MKSYKTKVDFLQITRVQVRESQDAEKSNRLRMFGVQYLRGGEGIKKPCNLDVQSLFHIEQQNQFADQLQTNLHTS